MLEEILEYLHNWFISPENIKLGTYSIESGYIDLPFLKIGQYFKINGSDLNDGVYQYPCTELEDECFYGSIWALSIPKALLDLVAEIEEWQEEYGSSTALLSPYQSESFGGYSYTKASSANDSSSLVAWTDVFASRLAGWRKI